MRLSSALFPTRLMVWRPLLPALLCVLICGACAQGVQTPEEPATPAVTSGTAGKPARTAPASKPVLSTSHTQDRHSSVKSAPAKTQTKPNTQTARHAKRPKAAVSPTRTRHATPPAIPAPTPSQSNFIGTNMLEYIGQKEQLCALTFDDGPTQHTPQLLQLLRERGIKATFFLLGSQVRRKPDLVRRIVAEGHEVANHSYSHPKLTRLSPEQQQQEIAAVQALFHKLGVEGRFLRPPYGSFNSATLQAAAEHDLDVILWSVDTNDWRQTLSIDGMSSRRGHDRPTRGVFLFHDTHLRTIKALPTLIDFLEANQCRFVTLSEYVGKPPLAGLKPQVAPVAAPSPAEAALPRQFPADDGSDDNTSRPQNALPTSDSPKASPEAPAEVILPMGNATAPTPAQAHPGTGTAASANATDRQPTSGATSRIPMTWDPAPVPPAAAPSTDAKSTLHTPASAGQPVLPAQSGQATPAQGSTSPAPAAKTPSASPAGQPTANAQDTGPTPANTPAAPVADKPSVATPHPVMPLGTVTGASAGATQNQPTKNGQSQAQGRSAKVTGQTAPSGSQGSQVQPQTMGSQSGTQPTSKPAPKHVPAQQSEEQENRPFWRIFDF